MRISMQAPRGTAEPAPLQHNHPWIAWSCFDLEWVEKSHSNANWLRWFPAHLLYPNRCLLQIIIKKKKTACMQDYQTHLTNSEMFSWGASGHIENSKRTAPQVRESPVYLAFPWGTVAPRAFPSGSEATWCLSSRWPRRSAQVKGRTPGVEGK